MDVKLTKIFRENTLGAMFTAFVGAVAGFSWTLGKPRIYFPSFGESLLSITIGVVFSVGLWIFLSSLFARLFKRPIKTVRRIDALSYIFILPFSCAGIQSIFQLNQPRKEFAIYFLTLFGAAKVGEALFFAIPRRGRALAALAVIALSAFVIYGQVAKNLFGQIEYWRDLEEIKLSDASSGFAGPKASRVIVNSKGRWRAATNVKSPGVYILNSRLEKPSKLALAFLSADDQSPAKVDMTISESNGKKEKKSIIVDKSDWMEIGFENEIASGEMEIRLETKSGGFWVSDPVITNGTDRPNVIVIFIDALRADHLSCYGYPRSTTPTIDDLAAKGTLFENHYAASSWTTSSMATFFTGLYPRQHGCIDFGSLSLPSEYETTAELFQRAGYRTFGISANPLLSVKTDFSQGFDVFDESCFGKNLYGSGECITDSALDEVNNDTPLFFFIHYYDAHLPYIAPPPYLFKFRNGIAGETKGGIIQFNINRYDESIEYCDAQIARLLAGLEKKGLLRNSIVIISADHGEEMADHGRFNHGFSVYEEVTHIPLIMSGRGIASGARVANLTSTVDMFAAILAFAGIEAKLPQSGRNIFPIDDDYKREWTISDMQDKIAFRTPEYKLIVDTALRKKMLFDPASDPGDQHDIAGEKPEIVKAAYQKLIAIIDKISEVKPREKRVGNAIKEHRDRLKALGYVQ